MRYFDEQHTLAMCPGRKGLRDRLVHLVIGRVGLQADLSRYYIWLSMSKSLRDFDIVFQHFSSGHLFLRTLDYFVVDLFQLTKGLSPQF